MTAKSLIEAKVELEINQELQQNKCMLSPSQSKLNQTILNGGKSTELPDNNSTIPHHDFTESHQQQHHLEQLEFEDVDTSPINFGKQKKIIKKKIGKRSKKKQCKISKEIGNLIQKNNQIITINNPNFSDKQIESNCENENMSEEQQIEEEKLRQEEIAIQNQVAKLERIKKLGVNFDYFVKFCGESHEIKFFEKQVEFLIQKEKEIHKAMLAASKEDPFVVYFEADEAFFGQFRKIDFQNQPEQLRKVYEEPIYNFDIENNIN